VILPRACRPSIKVCAFLMSSSGRTKVTTNLIRLLSTSFVTSVKTGPMGSDVAISCGTM
jgi:cobyrinic acid a,c-diamide synthase